MSKLTNKELEALQASDNGKRLREDGGLIGVVRAGETVVSVKWDWRYRFGGKVRQIALGSWPKESMPSIRAQRARLADVLRAGKDPADEKRAERLEAKAEQVEAIARSLTRIADAEAMKARMTVKNLFERWEELELSARKDKGADAKRSFNKDVIPNIGDMAAEDVRRADVARILDSVVSRGARIVARNLLGDIRQMYGFAIARGLLESDPTSHMKRDDYGRKVERERVLSEAEIKQLHATMQAAKLAPANELALWIQVATCCRVGELLKARWEHIDFSAATWRIPPDNAKNGKEHLIYLSSFALEQFKGLHRITGKRRNKDGNEIAGEWLYPARRNDSHVDEKTVTKQVADRQRGDKEAMKKRSVHGKALILPGGQWTPHDLRRTGATMMVELGVLPEVVERCLNHREQNRMKRIYQRHSYAPEMKRAWRILGERLELFRRNPGNVATLMPCREAA